MTRKKIRDRENRKILSGFRDVVDFVTGNRDSIPPWWVPAKASENMFPRKLEKLEKDLQYFFRDWMIICSGFMQPLRLRLHELRSVADLHSSGP